MKSLLDQMLGGEFFSHELPIRRTPELLAAEKKLEKIGLKLEAELGEDGHMRLDEYSSAKNACDFLTCSQTEKDMFCLGAFLMLEIVTHANQVFTGSPNTKTSRAENSRPPTGQIPFTSGEELKRV